MSNYFKFYFWNFQRYYLGQLLLGQHSSSQLNYCWANILAQQYSSNIGPNNQYCSNIGCCNIAAMLLQYWSNIFVWTNIVWTNIAILLQCCCNIGCCKIAAILVQTTNITAILVQYWPSNIGPYWPKQLLLGQHSSSQLKIRYDRIWPTFRYFGEA